MNTRTQALWAKIDDAKKPVYMGVHSLAVLAATAYKPLCDPGNAALTVMEAGAAAFELTLGVESLADYMHKDMEDAYDVIDKINGWFSANGMTALPKPIRQVMRDMDGLRANSLELNKAINEKRRQACSKQ